MEPSSDFKFLAKPLHVVLVPYFQHEFNEGPTSFILNMYIAVVIYLPCIPCIPSHIGYIYIYIRSPPLVRVCGVSQLSVSLHFNNQINFSMCLEGNRTRKVLTQVSLKPSDRCSGDRPRISYPLVGG